MAVFRVERTRDYTVMSNFHLQRQAVITESERAALSDVIFAG